MTTTQNQGKLHRHQDGTEHRHFAEGFTIGGQVRPDCDGTEAHSHGTLNMVSGESKTTTGPMVEVVVTVEDWWRAFHDTRTVWRTATRKEHTCGDCKRTITLGERYLDTGEAVDVWRTAKCCAECAAKPSRYPIETRYKAAQS